VATRAQQLRAFAGKYIRKALTKTQKLIAFLRGKPLEPELRVLPMVDAVLDGEVARFRVRDGDPEQIAPRLHAAKNEILRTLRARSKGVKFRGDYQHGWYGQVDGNTLTVANKAPHMVFVERGRRPNKRQPPTSAIEPWCLAKGMKKDAVFPIARAIGKRGIKPRPLFLLSSTQRDLARIVERHVSEEY
jgi:hypothetical protein